jgi:opacity protein-like surface antigen
MYKVRGGLRQRRFWPGIVIILLTFGFLAPLPRPAMALESTNVRNGAFIGCGVIMAAAAGYAMWLNRPGNDFSWAPRGPGGFYVGLGGGANFVGPANWTIKVPGTTITRSVAVTSTPLLDAKFGYFFHQLPYLGVESELMYTSNKMSESFRLARPIYNANTASFNGIFDNVSLVLRLMGRYGFLPDSEVPFGRLQPYVGIGPGLELVIGQNDTSKKIALELSAGVKYMIFKNLSAYAEYKYSYQWAVFIDPQSFKINGGPGQIMGHNIFDYTRHMVTAGLAFHFL